MLKRMFSKAEPKLMHYHYSYYSSMTISDIFTELTITNEQVLPVSFNFFVKMSSSYFYITDGHKTKKLVCERSVSLSDRCAKKLSMTATATLLPQYDLISLLAALSPCC